MWKQRLQKLLDNPLLPFTHARTRWYWEQIADAESQKYSDIKFLNGKETIAAITTQDRSIIRAGDGTFGYLLGSSIYFNNWHFRYNRAFAKKLEHVMKQSSNSRILFCYPHTFIKKTKAQFEAESIGAEWKIWTASKILLKKFITADVTYGDALCFHPRFNTGIDFTLLKKYFDTKHIIIITSNTERFKDIKLGKSTTFIEGPSSDAWQVYEELEAKGKTAALATNAQKNDVLFMISAAEAAKVMVYDLTRDDYTAWDAGQFFDLAAKEITALSA